MVTFITLSLELMWIFLDLKAVFQDLPHKLKDLWLALTLLPIILYNLFLIACETILAFHILPDLQL